MSKKDKHFCLECGSILIETSRLIRQSANPLYPITEVKYRCTNDICQAGTDKRRAEVVRIKQEREEKTLRLKNNFSKTQIPKVS